MKTIKDLDTMFLYGEVWVRRELVETLLKDRIVELGEECKKELDLFKELIKEDEYRIRTEKEIEKELNHYPDEPLDCENVKEGQGCFVGFHGGDACSIYVAYEELQQILESSEGDK